MHRHKAFLFLILALVLNSLFFFFNKTQTEIIELPTSDVTTTSKEELLQETASFDNEEALHTKEQASSEFPRLSDVLFPNGAHVEVVYQLTSSHNVPSPRKGALNVYIFELMGLAVEGNAGAAQGVYSLLSDCSSTPRTQSEFNDSLMELQTSGKVTHASGMGVTPGHVFPVGSEVHSMAVNTVRLKYESCSRVTDLQISEREKWNTMAKELGSARALGQRARELLQTDPEAAFEVYQQLWNAGEISFASELQRAYQTGTAPKANGKPDLITAYAFELLLNKVFEQAHYDSKNPNATNLAAMMDESLAQLAANLTYEQKISAEERAVKLLKENQNCCKGIWTAF